MPGGGSKPGERRGGRQKGTPNKKTILLNAELAELTNHLPADQIAAMKPLDLVLYAMREALWRGRIASAAALAARAAPYVHTRLRVKAVRR